MSTPSCKRGELFKSRVYLSGPMENATNGRGWRETAKLRLRKLGIICFDPYEKPFEGSFKEDDKTRDRLHKMMERGAFKAVSARMRRVRNEDLRICDISDFALIVVDPKVASWGTAEELFELNSQKKPIFSAVIGGRKRTPLWLMGTLPAHYFYDSVDDALDMIERIDRGEKEIDSDRWRLLKLEYR